MPQKNPAAAQIAEIRKAYAEFEAGLMAIRRDTRVLVERAIKKIDLQKADKILQSIRTP